MAESVSLVKLLATLPGWILFGLSVSPASVAQITADQTLPIAERSQVSGGNNVQIEGGATRGNNLFHSFSQFSIPSGGSAFFNNAANIQNIFSRVTGGSVSTIDGLIQANGNANLFLLNPNGILFGSNARLNIGGSLVVSTANSIHFADGSQFSARESQTASLLTITVPIGLQMGQDSGSIIVQGDGYNLSAPVPFFAPTVRSNSGAGLQVASGRMLALLGGDITIAGGTLTAEQGRIELGSVREGLVSLTTPNLFTFAYSSVQQFGSIQLSQQALVDASGNGVIQVQGDRVSIVDGSLMFIQNQGSQQGGNLNINAGVLTLSGASPDGASFIGGLRSETTGSGSGADITVFAGRFFAQEGAGILPISYGSGASGNVLVSAADQLYLVGFSQASATVQTLINTVGLATGNAGNVTVATQQLKLENGAYIGTQINSFDSATRGGDITLNAESIEMFGVNPLTVSNVSTASNFAGDAGNITVNTSRLSIRDGTAIATYTLGSGNAGRVTLNATESIDISGEVSLRSATFASTVSSFAPAFPELGFPIPSGNSGDLILNTPSLRVTNGATIDVSNEGTGNAGTLRINANSIVLNQGGSITAATASGEGGNITLQVEGALLLRRNSQITTSAGGTGNGGNLTINTGSLVAVPAENSDIRADSVNARGGNVVVDARGLFGIQFRPELTPQSDITATGANSALNGTINLDVERTDFNREFVQLPADLVDASGLIAQGCREIGESSFVVTGRGGLPPTPTQTASNDPVWHDRRDLTVLSRSAIVPQPAPSVVTNVVITKNTPRSAPFVEATRWYVDEQGRILLTATKSVIHSYQFSEQSMCNGS
jgi:filamentous hemagglutinin family protein